jgi:glucokinase
MAADIKHSYDDIGLQDANMKAKMPVLGIDLGGTKLAAAVILDRKIISETKQTPTPSGPEHIVEAILSLIEQFKKDYLLTGVGIATAGIVDVSTGTVIGSTGNLPGWEGTPLKTLIEGKTMLPVHVENDANAAAYGEFHHNQLHYAKCVIVVTFGTGIGAGIVIDDRLYRGDHFAAGECGHMKVSMDNKRLCTCGLWDCWEAYGSGRGLLLTGLDLLAQGNASTEMKKETLTTQIIIDQAKKGDLLAQKAVSLWHEHALSGLISLAHTFDPDCFLISGGMSKFIDFDLLREMFIDRTLPRIAEKVKIFPATLGTESGMIGAAELVLDNIIAQG